MIRYVDTNVLVRIMTNDVPELAQKAISEVRASKPKELVILDAALVELFFVLEMNKNYRYSRDKIGVIFNGILNISQFKVSDKSKSAFSLFISHPELDFMDCLIAISAKGRNENALTFDGDLKKVLA